MALSVLRVGQSGGLQTGMGAWVSCGDAAPAAGTSPLHTGASASETAQTQWFSKAASVLGNVLTLAVCVTLALCSSLAELSNGPVTPSAPPFIQSKQKNAHLQVF